MAIPKNISKEHLLKAILKIDKDGIPKDGNSLYYDVVYNGKKYPPKIIVSYANIFANGEELDRNSFSGGLGTQCFKLLEQNDFIIQKKSTDNMSYYRELKNFLIVADKQTIGQGTIDVQQYNQERLTEFRNLKVESSLGIGRATAVPWIAFLYQIDSVQNGIYPVYLYYKPEFGLRFDYNLIL